MFGTWGKLPMIVVKGIIATLVVPFGFVMIKGTIEATMPPALLAELQGYQVGMLTSLIPIVYILASIVWVFSDLIFPKTPGQ
jgi:hypothetical protein